MAWQEIAGALGAAGVGGIVLKLGESWLTRSKQKSEQDRALRDELRTEANSLRAEIALLKTQLKEAEAELDKMKEKYWSIYMEYNQFKLYVQQTLVKYGVDLEEFTDELREYEQGRSSE